MATSRSVRHALPGVCRSTRPWTVTFGSRPFSCSAVRYGETFPEFVESSSPELHELLANIRQKNILPGYLNNNQYNVVTQQKYRNQLQQDPLKIEIDGVDVFVGHLDVIKDIPQRKRGIRKVLGLIKEENDFENMSKLLAGFEGTRGNGMRSHTKLSGDIKRSIVRRLGALNQVPLIIKMLRDPTRYGLRLTDPQILESSVLGIHFHAARHAWEEQETRSAFSFAEQLVDFLERKEHGGDLPLEPSNPRRLQYVVALPLEMAATLVRNKQANALEKQKARDYAERLIGALEQNPDDMETWLESSESWTAIVRCVIVQDALSKALSVADDIQLQNEDLAQRTEQRLRDLIKERASKRQGAEPVQVPFQDIMLGISLKNCGLI